MRYGIWLVMGFAMCAATARGQEVRSVVAANGSCGCGTSSCGQGGCGAGCHERCCVGKIWDWATYRACNRYTYCGCDCGCYPPLYTFFGCREGKCAPETCNTCGQNRCATGRCSTGGCGTCRSGLFQGLFGCTDACQGGSSRTGDIGCAPTGTVPYHPTTYKGKLAAAYGSCGN